MLWEVVEELRREAATRERLYPRWIEEGRLSQPLAKERLFALENAIWILSHLAQDRTVESVVEALKEPQ